MTRDILFMTAVKRSEKLKIPIASCVWHDNWLTYREMEGCMKIQFTGNRKGCLPASACCCYCYLNGVYVSATCTCELRKYIYMIPAVRAISRDGCTILSLPMILYHVASPDFPMQVYFFRASVSTQSLTCRISTRQ